MRYIQMNIGNEDGDPGLTLYEIDDLGWVHRQIQIGAESTRFSPEDILMRKSVNANYLASHSSSEEIDKSEFEMLWQEVRDSRSFCDRVPDIHDVWFGEVDGGSGPRFLAWIPDDSSVPSRSWERVPGFDRLYAYVPDGSPSVWRTQGDVLLERGIRWRRASGAKNDCA